MSDMEQMLPVTDHGPVLLSMGEVMPEPLRWLWPGRVALGKLTLIAGDPGLGKSYIALDMAARLSRGVPWPDGTMCECGPSRTLLLSAEDDPGDTLHPRLRALGADLWKVIVFRGLHHRELKGRLLPFNLDKHLHELVKVLEQHRDIKLLVIDPISAYMGQTDSHRNTDVRNILAPLAMLAQVRGVAVVAVTHLNKGSAMGPSQNPLYRAMGSLAFTAAARTVHMVHCDRQDRSRRLVLPVKNNLSSDEHGLAYRIVPGEQGATLEWESQAVQLTAQEIMESQSPGGPRRDSEQMNAALQHLMDHLKPLPKPVVEVVQAARAAGISDATLRRAKKALGIASVRKGFGEGSAVLWVLPEMLNPDIAPGLYVRPAEEEKILASIT